jgi:hypothetical protein
MVGTFKRINAMNLDKLIYTSFLSIGTVVELANAFGFSERLGVISLIYIIGFFVIVFKLSSEYAWIWSTGFLIIGLISLITITLRAMDRYTENVRMMDGVLCALIYFICLIKMHKKSNEVKS